MKILIIDDDENYRELLQEVIRRMGHEVESVATAIEGLEKIKKYSYELLVVDYLIPGMTGLELIREIRRSNQELQIIVVSGYDSFPDQNSTSDLKLAGYLTKPIDFEKFEALIQKISTNS